MSIIPLLPLLILVGAGPPSPAAQAASALAPTSGIQLGPSTDYPVGLLPTSLEVGDLDGDNRPDVVTTNALSGDLSLLFNQGAGRLGVEQRLSGTGGQPRDVAIGDVDGDGFADIVASIRSGTSAADVWLGRGDGTFDPPLGVGAPGNHTAMGLADLDDDGHLDLVLGSLAQGLTDPTVSVRRGLGDGTFGAPAIYAFLPGQPAYDLDLSFGDVDGTGGPDIVATGYPFGSFCALFVNRGDGTFDLTLRTPPAARLMGVAFEDVDADGDDDLAFVDGDPALGQALVIERNDGTGSFSAVERYSIGGSAGFKEARRAIVVGDFDLDGVTDIITSGGIFRGIPGAFDPIVRPDIGRFEARTFDVDADGDLDLVAAGHNGSFSGRVRVYLNQEHRSGPLWPRERSPRATLPIAGSASAAVTVSSSSISTIGQP